MVFNTPIQQAHTFECDYLPVDHDTEPLLTPLQCLVRGTDSVQLETLETKCVLAHDKCVDLSKVLKGRVCVSWLEASLASNAAPSVVVRETARREESFQALKERGAPHEPAQYPDADEAASVLLAAGGPVDMAYHALKL